MSNFTNGFLTNHKMVFLISQIGQKFGQPKKINQKNSSIVNIKMYIINTYLPTHPPMTYLPTMASYLLIHNPPMYYTFTHMYKVYIQIYILHIVYVGKGN
jgi:hypothetical protein